MVDLGILRNNPDYFAVSVMNEIFGGGFSSRLFNNVRATKGLAYSVGGGVGTSFNHPGMTHIQMQTKSGSTVAGIEALYEEIDNMHAEGARRRRVEARQGPDPQLVHLPLRHARQSAAREDDLRVLSLPARFPGAVSRGDRQGDRRPGARRSRKKYLQKDKLAVLVVGNDTEFDKPLSSLGPVTTVDITIPPPPKELMQQMGMQGPGQP